MKLTSQETKFLTALIREQNQTGCRGPAHDLLRKHAYPDAPLTGRNSLAFAYEVVPLTTMLVADFGDLEAFDDFVRNAPLITDVEWPWSSGEEFRGRLEEARRKWKGAGPWASRQPRPPSELDGIASTAAARRPARIALQAGPIANHGELPAFRAGIAFVALEAGD